MQRNRTKASDDSVGRTTISNDGPTLKYGGECFFRTRPKFQCYGPAGREHNNAYQSAIDEHIVGVAGRNRAAKTKPMRALHDLYLVDRNDPLTEIIARKIIEIGHTGITDTAQISKLA